MYCNFFRGHILIYNFMNNLPFGAGILSRTEKDRGMDTETW